MIKKRFNTLKPHLDERMRRLVAAAEAKVLGHGGITAVSRATGLSRNTVARGIEELEGLPASSFQQRTRRRGGGRKREVIKDPTLLRDLECLLEPWVRGEPAASLQWTCLGLRRLAEELRGRGHTTSHRMVGELLHHMGYRFQRRNPAPSGLSRRERHAGFERIHRQVERFHRKHLPVLALEMKKRTRFCTLEEPPPDSNGSAEWTPAAADRTTGAVAVESLRRWWLFSGALLYPEADALLLTVEGAGSSLYRSGRWKQELQGFADAFGLTLTVLRFPVGRHKWSGIEDRTVARVRQERNRGPCTEHEVIVNWIGPEEPGHPREAPCPPGFRLFPEEKEAAEDLISLDRPSGNEAFGRWDFSLAPLLQKTH